MQNHNAEPGADPKVVPEPLERFNRALSTHISVAQDLSALGPNIIALAARIAQAFKKGNKLLLCGNGGSAADAQHWAAEWCVRLSAERTRKALPALALTTDTSTLTACGNDMGFSEIFARQIQAHARPGDHLLAISTSGNSENLLRAAEEMRRQGGTILGILGGKNVDNVGGKLKALCDACIIVPSDDTQHIQEMHSFIGHQLCALSEHILFDINP